MDHLLEEAAIQGNKIFKRLEMATQVLLPKFGGEIGLVGEDVSKNRLTHSFEVATVSEIVAANLQFPEEANHARRLRPISLLHDIGHAPFGHEGGEFLDRKMKELGLEEGFSDNNNNFVVIRKNGIEVSPYTLASLVKYPERLYEGQKPLLLPILERAIDEDIRVFEGKIQLSARPKRTIGCAIMDEADRIAYTCSDLADGISLGIIPHDPLQRLLDENRFVSGKIRELLVTLAYGTEKGDKNLINSALVEARLLFAQNHFIKNDLSLGVIDEELLEFREALSNITFSSYIRTEQVTRERDVVLDMLRRYVEWVLEGNYPSRTYASLIKRSRGKNRLRHIRDMIAETTDWYVINTVKRLNL